MHATSHPSDHKILSKMYINKAAVSSSGIFLQSSASVSRTFIIQLSLSSEMLKPGFSIVMLDSRLNYSTVTHKLLGLLARMQTGLVTYFPVFRNLICFLFSVATISPDYLSLALGFLVLH